VLTLPATGSEFNHNAVISRRETEEKLSFSSERVYPKFSILDPETTYSLPQKQLRNGLVDAYVHVMEQYMTYPVGAIVQDRQAEALLMAIIEMAPAVLNTNHPDYDARANFMWVCSNALNYLIGVGVPQDWATHRIGHELTALYGLAHAESLAVVLPWLLWYKRDQNVTNSSSTAIVYWIRNSRNTLSALTVPSKQPPPSFRALACPRPLPPLESTPTKLLRRCRRAGKLGGGASVNMAISLAPTPRRSCV